MHIQEDVPTGRDISDINFGLRVAPELLHLWKYRIARAPRASRLTLDVATTGGKSGGKFFYRENVRNFLPPALLRAIYSHEGALYFLQWKLVFFSRHNLFLISPFQAYIFPYIGFSWKFYVRVYLGLLIANTKLNFGNLQDSKWQISNIKVQK